MGKWKGRGCGGKGMAVVCERGRGDIRIARDDGWAVSGCGWKEGRKEMAILGGGHWGDRCASW